MKLKSTLLYITAATLTFSSCQIGKHYTRPELNLPEQLDSTQQDTLTIAEMQWWEIYTDTTLQNLIIAYYLGEINMIHPFREGNGRTQRIYIEQLCLNNGRFEIDFTDVSKEEMIAASVRSANASNDMLEELISSCLVEK